MMTHLAHRRRQMRRFGALVVALAAISVSGALVAHAAPEDSISPIVADGRFSSMALNDQGNPVVAFTDDNLKLAVCDDPLCTDGGELVIPVDDDAATGIYAELALDSDGLPSIAYSTDGGEIRFVRCDDPWCVAETPTVIGADNSPSWLGLEIDPTGRAVILYNEEDWNVPDPPATRVRLAVCETNDPNCEDPTRTTLMTVEGYSPSKALALGNDGLPVVVFSHFDGVDIELAFVRCDDIACINETPKVLATDAGGVDVTVDALDRPVIAYNGYDGGVYLIRCNNPACSSFDGPTFLSALSHPDRSISIGMRSFSRPVVAIAGGDHTDASLASATVVSCNNPTCTSHHKHFADPDLGVGFHPSLQLDADGHAVVSYTEYGDSPNEMRLAHCTFCVSEGRPWLPELPR